MEDDAQVEVLNPTVRQAGKRKRVNKGPEKRSIHLVELGPRMTIEMVKIEEGLADGKTLWHSYEKKTKDQEREMERRHAQKQMTREKRRKEQLENVRKKKEALAALKTSTGRRGARPDGEEGEDEGGDEVEEASASDEEIWDDDELDQYEADHIDDEDEEMEE